MVGAMTARSDKVEKRNPVLLLSLSTSSRRDRNRREEEVEKASRHSSGNLSTSHLIQVGSVSSTALALALPP
jgi:hypothetical protein